MELYLIFMDNLLTINILHKEIKIEKLNVTGIYGGKVGY